MSAEITQADIRAKLRDYITRELAPGRKLGDDESLLETAIIDSMGIVNLTVFIETAFGVALDDDDLDPDNFETITVLSQVIAHRARGTAARSG